MLQVQLQLLYCYRFSNGYVVPSDPPNNGTLVMIGNLGINVDADNGFDIGGNSAISLCFY
jgi:hypothetical protein